MITDMFEYDGKEVVWEALEEDLRKVDSNGPIFQVVCYMFAKGAFLRDGEGVVFSEEGINPDVIAYLKKRFKDLRFECKTLSALNLFDSREVFARGVCRSSISRPLPISMEKVAYKMLDIEPGDRVGILTGGYGNFGAYSSGMCPSATFEEIDENEDKDRFLLREIRTDILGGNFNFRRENIFDLPGKGDRYNKMFLGWPRLASDPSTPNPITQEIAERYPWLAPSIPESDDESGEVASRPFAKYEHGAWDLASLAIDLLEEGGKAVVAMYVGDDFFYGKLRGPRSALARQHFIEEGLVETIVFLPIINDFSDWTFNSGNWALVLLSRGNDKVRFVDFSNDLKPIPMYANLSDEDVEKIAYELKTDCKNVFYISNEDIIQSECYLKADYYETHIINPGTAFPLSAFIKEIREGVSLSAADIAKMASPKRTNVRYIASYEVGASGIEGEGQCLSRKMTERSFKDQYVKNRSLIISKKAPHKIAVIDVPEARKILLDSDFYIIEVDEEKADPYYLTAFLLSDKGAPLLEGLNSGADVFMKMDVPLPPMALQNGVGRQYKEKINELKKILKRYERVAKKLKTVYDVL